MFRACILKKRAEGRIELVDAAGPFEVERCQVFYHLVLFPVRHILECIHPFLFVPQPAIHIGEAGEDLADRAGHLGNVIAFFSVHLVRGEGQPFGGDRTGDGPREKTPDLLLKLFLLNGKALLHGRIVSVPLFELDNGELVAKRTERLCHNNVPAAGRVVERGKRYRARESSFRSRG